MTTTATQSERLNGISLAQMHKLIGGVQADPANAQTHWGVTTRWVSGAVSETEVRGFQIGAQRVKRGFRFRTDEPAELAGTNTQPNPQEYLLGALNACMVVGYVAVATHMGIELDSLEIEASGEIDLRGFLGLDPSVKPGYDEIRYTVRIKANATEAQIHQIHETVKKTSPNYFNLSQPVKLTSDLVIV